MRRTHQQAKTVNPSDRVDQRLTDLEVKLSLTEDLADRLNDIVARQQSQIDLLVREVRRLTRLTETSDEPAFRSLRDELPPHY
jgi:SlyX protein